jgi:putative transposase
VLAGLAHVLPMLANARDWQSLIRGANRPSLFGMLHLVWIREGSVAVRRSAMMCGTTRTTESSMKTLNPAVARVLKRLHYPLDVILTCVRWYVAYPLSLRHLEDMMAERGVSVDHSTVHRWAIKLLPVLEKAFRLRKRPVGKSWRMDETYIRVKGEWRYLYRAVDKDGKTIDFLLRAHRDKTAARSYFEKSIAQNGVPETVTIDKSGANLAALEAINADREAPIKIRQSKYLNNLVEQDHRAIKRRTRPMLGFKTFRCARILLAGIEVMHMIAKGQMKCARGTHPSAADQFYDLTI